MQSCLRYSFYAGPKRSSLVIKPCCIAARVGPGGAKCLNITAHDKRARASRYWIPTAGIADSGGEGNEAIAPLVRGGFLRQAYSGVFHLLPLGVKVQDKLEKLIDKHMQSIGANKVSLATITSEALWRKSGRYTGNNPEMFHVASQNQKPTGYLLSPTHEEEITNVIANTVTSYKDLPLRLYQISRKYRNELRPRAGLLRTREFLMKDLYTFDTSPSSALTTYAAVKKAYANFFDELTIPYIVADADTGMMGGDLSHEFHFESPLGEDNVIACIGAETVAGKRGKGCGFAVNEELAASKLQKDSDGSWSSHPCPNCSGQLKEHRAVELGHTFYLGTRYSEPLNASVGVPSTVSGAEGGGGTEYKRTPLSMGCHGIGISRLLGAIPAVLGDEKGPIWPRPIAPFDVLIMSTLKDSSPSSTTTTSTSTITSATTTPTISTSMEALHDELTSESVGGLRIDAVIDDREGMTPGWRFTDAELVGYPVVVLLGRGWKKGFVEVQCRRLGIKEEVSREEVVYYVCHLLARL